MSLWTTPLPGTRALAALVLLGLLASSAASVACSIKGRLVAAAPDRALPLFETERKALGELDAARCAILVSERLDQSRSGEAMRLSADATSVADRLGTGRHRFDAGFVNAVAMRNLSQVAYSQGRYDEELDLLTHALAMQERLFDADDPELATTALLPGFNLADRGRYEEAQQADRDHQNALMQPASSTPNPVRGSVFRIPRPSV